jgi:hypothetical protein
VPPQVGLFSAIVTAFFVDSLSKLQPDEAARTNDLLVNLTEIVLIASGIQFNTTNLPLASSFVPDPADVRKNVYWSISLSLSVSMPLLQKFLSNVKHRFLPQLSLFYFVHM